MAALSTEVRAFIVQSLACFEPPTKVIELVKAEFNVQVSRQQVSQYSPGNAMAAKLSQKWIDLFESTRARFQTEISDTGSKVARQESWVAIVANKVKSLFTPQDAPATNHQTEGDMPLTKEELEQIGTIVSGAIAANNEASLKPITEALAGIQANQKTLSDSLTANSRAEEKTKRDAVAAVHGKIVANALSGEALDAMFKSLGEAAPLGTNSAKNPPVTGAPDPAAYFGGAA